MGREVSGGRGKATESDHLAQVAKQLGKDLIEVEQDIADSLMPEAAAYLWVVFLELHDGRTYGMSGPNPISYGIINDWCQLMCVDLRPWEVTIVKSLDNIWMKTIGEDDNG